MEKKVFEIGSEYDWDSNILLLKPLKNDVFLNVNEQKIKFLRSGRDAIRYVARLCREKCGTVLMPALACACMPEPFEEEGYKIIYYKVREDFSVDIEDIKRKLVSNSIFFFMNYFGQRSITQKELQQLKRNVSNLIVVEDITHDFLKRRKDVFQCDFTVCSIRKWFAIPDGGVIIGREVLETIEVGTNSYFAELRADAMKQKSLYLRDGTKFKKDVYRNMLATSNEYIDCTKDLIAMQKESKEILFHIDLEQIYELRKKNINILKRKIREISGVKSLIETCEDSTLYYPIYVEGNSAQLQRKMAEKSIYLPVIWPLPQGAEEICKVADDVTSNMLAIPCDHRYDTKEMNKIIDVIKECLQESEY